MLVPFGIQAGAGIDSTVKTLIAGTVMAALVLTGAWLGLAEARRVPARVTIAGTEVGGRSTPEAHALVHRAAAQITRRPILLRHGRVVVRTSGLSLGASPAIDEAVAQAERSRGAAGRVRARFRLSETVAVPLRFRLDRRRLAALLRRVERRIAQPALGARVRLSGPELIVVPPRPGRTLDRATLAAELETLPNDIRVPLRTVRPRIRASAAIAARRQALALIARRPILVHGRSRVLLRARDLRRALRFEPRASRLAVRLDPRSLAGVLRPVFSRYERPARNASFRVAGGSVELQAAQFGRRLDLEATARGLVQSKGQRVAVRFRSAAPARTTAEARAMRIRELISEFTTYYPCCPPRVTNIQRAAAILDGKIIPAGARFSLNEALGERTRERGFVEAPMILAGRLVDAVGGGVSQVATTFYNAAFFAGLELIAHTPHQFYISRYPMGREATVSWGGPELVFRNDWPAAILVKVEAGATSISVRFYSARLGRRVRTETGAPYSMRPAETRTVVNRSLPRGSRVTVQEGGIAGFSVDYTRRVYRGEKLIRNEHFHVEYDPEDTIVEVGPPSVKPKPDGDGPPAPTGTRADRPATR